MTPLDTLTELKTVRSFRLHLSLAFNRFQLIVKNTSYDVQSTIPKEQLSLFHLAVAIHLGQQINTNYQNQ